VLSLYSRKWQQKTHTGADDESWMWNRGRGCDCRWKTQSRQTSQGKFYNGGKPGLVAGNWLKAVEGNPSGWPRGVWSVFSFWTVAVSLPVVAGASDSCRACLPGQELSPQVAPMWELFCIDCWALMIVGLLGSEWGLEVGSELGAVPSLGQPPERRRSEVVGPVAGLGAGFGWLDSVPGVVPSEDHTSVGHRAAVRSPVEDAAGVPWCLASTGMVLWCRGTPRIWRIGDSPFRVPWLHVVADGDL